MWVFLLSVPLSLCFWWLLNRMSAAWKAYRRRLDQETRNTLTALFLFIDLGQIWWAVSLALAGSALLLAWFLGRWWGILPVLSLILVIPRLVLQHLRARRRAQFDDQLPDMVLSLAGALQAGAALQQALQYLAEHTRPPLSQELKLMLRQQRLGVSAEEALLQLHERMPTQACGLMVSALSVALQTGGNLSTTLENVALMLRLQQHWIGRVRALTAQGRLQSHIMLGLPLLLLVALSYLESEAMSLLWRTWYGGCVLVLLVVLEALGFLWIRRVVRFTI